jgi:hypothetical protein
MNFKRILNLTLAILLTFSAAAFSGESFNYPKFQAISSAGKPLVGAKVFCYIAGTDTKKASYSDAACTAQNTNPVVLDARGEATIYLNGDYKIVLAPATDSDPPSAPIWTMDGVSGTNEAAASTYYPDYTAADQGLTGLYNTVKYWIDTIGTTNKATLVLKHNSGDEWTDYVFGTAESVPANITLEFENGARLSTASVTITLNSPAQIKAQPSQQIVTGAGTVSFAKGATLHPEWWATNTTPGTTDMSAAWNAAETAAASSTPKSIVKNGSSKYYFGSVVNVLAPTFGDSHNLTTIVCGITNGTAAFQITNYDYWQVENFFIISNTNPTISNFIGVRSSDYSSWYNFKNVKVQAAARAFDLSGWVPNTENLQVYNCTEGFVGTAINGGIIDIKVEGAATSGLRLENTSGTTVTGMMESVTGIGTILNKCAGVKIDLYTEANGTDVYIGQTAGNANKCENITIIGGDYVSTSGNGIIVDNVDGFGIEGSPRITCPITTTTTTRNANLSIRQTSQTDTNSRAYYKRVRDNSKWIAPAENYFPNSDFAGGLRGFSSAVLTNVTVAEETTTVRRKTGLKVTASNGSGAGNARINLPDNILADLKGQTVMFAAQIYIPDLSEYSGTTNLPDVTLYAAGGAGGTASTYQTTKGWIYGSWNLFAFELDIPADATSLYVKMFPNILSNLATGNEYIIITRMVITPKCDIAKIANGDTIDSSKGFYWDGPSLVTYGTAAPTDADLYGALGDRVINTAITIDGTNSMILREWICTTAGNPGTWTAQYTSTIMPAH